MSFFPHGAAPPEYAQPLLTLDTPLLAHTTAAAAARHTNA